VNATLLVDNSTFIVTDRLNDAAGITLTGANLTFLANNTTGTFGLNTSETVGTITLAGGQSTINAGFATFPAVNVTSAITSAGLVRNTAATVNFIGGTGTVTPLGTTTNQFKFTGALPGLFTGNQGTIIPYAEVNGSSAGSGDFATSGAN